MPLGDLTDPEAVLKASREYDRLGQHAFLTKYGFGPAREYLLVYKGRSYDSKAIAGVAYGYQFPRRGPLKATEFSGGALTVARKLRNLGFEVRSSTNRPDARRYWALCANPSRYRIRDAVRDLETDHWTTGDRDLSVGDRVVIWQTTDSNGRRGIIALGEVTGPPATMVDERNPYWIDREGARSRESRVVVRYVVPRGLPLWIGSSPHDDIVSALSVARARGGTVFHVSPDQWQKLVDLLGWVDESLEVAAIAERVRPHARRRARGQGHRGLTAAERRAVELHAMALAIRYFSHEWPEVADVSASASFDLLCRSPNDELHVEVKGTTTEGLTVLLTRNEVEHARDAHPSVALFIVSEVELVRRGSGLPQARGGRYRLYAPWRPEKDGLRPLGYEYDLSLDSPADGAESSKDKRGAQLASEPTGRADGRGGGTSDIQ